MNLGSPPTARNARTGEFTPPGITRFALSKRARLFNGSFMKCSVLIDQCEFAVADTDERNQLIVATVRVPETGTEVARQVTGFKKALLKIDAVILQLMTDKEQQFIAHLRHLTGLATISTKESPKEILVPRLLRICEVRCRQRNAQRLVRLEVDRIVVKPIL